MNCFLLLTCSSAGNPVLCVVGLIQLAYNHTPGSTGVNEFAFFQIDAYMGYLLSGAVAGEKDQIAFPQVAFCHLITLFLLSVRTAGQFRVVYFFIYMAGKSGTIGPPFRISSCAVRDADPFGRFQIEFVIIFQTNVYAQTDRSTC